MEEAAEPIVIPGWIWVMVVMFVIGVIVALVIKRDRDGSSRHRSGRHHRSSSSRRHRSSGSSGSSGSSSRHRRREGDPFDKY